MNNIDDRIRSLEQSNLRLRRSVISLAALVATITALGAIGLSENASFDTVTCKALKVVDAAGKVRLAAMPVGAAGSMYFACFDTDSKPRIGIGVTKEGDASVDLCDKDGSMRISSMSYADGAALTRWFDKNGDPRIVAGTTPRAESPPTFPTKDLKK